MSAALWPKPVTRSEPNPEDLGWDGPQSEGKRADKCSASLITPSKLLENHFRGQSQVCKAANKAKCVYFEEESLEPSLAQLHALGSARESESPWGTMTSGTHSSFITCANLLMCQEFSLSQNQGRLITGWQSLKEGGKHADMILMSGTFIFDSSREKYFLNIILKSSSHLLLPVMNISTAPSQLCCILTVRTLH